MKELGRIITLHTISDPRGNLTVAEENLELPFDLKRAYWIYNVPQGGSRGGHAHKRLRQVLIAVSGSSPLPSTTEQKPRPTCLTTQPKGCSSTRRYGAPSMISQLEPSAWSWHRNFTNQTTTSTNTTIF